ncbi:hypothetical protein E0K83_09560 [Gramella sp. BOM4]|nr:hypothetical protein [Christiangramia bathymodioli]
MKTNYLFPNRFKKVGWMLLIPSAILGIFVLFFDFEFTFLDGKIYTLYTGDFLGEEGGFFKSFNGNYTKTIVGLIFLSGAVLVAFSKEKYEDEFVSKIRLESLVWAIYINYLVLAICFLLFYDLDFLMVMILNMFTILIFFIVRFYYSLYQTKKQLGYEK